MALFIIESIYLKTIILLVIHTITKLGLLPLLYVLSNLISTPI